MIDDRVRGRGLADGAVVIGRTVGGRGGCVVAASVTCRGRLASSGLAAMYWMEMSFKCNVLNTGPLLSRAAGTEGRASSDCSSYDACMHDHEFRPNPRFPPAVSKSNTPLFPKPNHGSQLSVRFDRELQRDLGEPGVLRACSDNFRNSTFTKVPAQHQPVD